jgi:tryptophan synthase, alpha subunit
MKKFFFPYLLAGYPSLSRFSDVLDVTIPYADVIEIGIPFSDPVADGPVIREAATQVLSKGFSLDATFKTLQRKSQRLPMALMSYANPILAYGRREFLLACKQVGLKFLIVPDVPEEESIEWKEEANRAGIDWISFISLQTRAERLKQIATSAEGFLYLLSLTGVTGARIHSPEDVQKKAAEVQQYTRIPIALGFGIKSVKDVLLYRDRIDAFIVGSKIIELISTTSLTVLESFYREFCSALRD